LEGSGAVAALGVAGIDTGKVLDCMGKPEADEDHPILKQEQIAQVRGDPLDYRTWGRNTTVQLFQVGTRGERGELLMGQESGLLTPGSAV